MNDLVLLYTGTEVVIENIRSELKTKGIESIVKDGFRDGLKAGFGGEVPSAVEIFVTKDDFQTATEIRDAILS